MTHADRPDPDTVILENGALAATPEQVLAALEALGIKHDTFTHEPLYTVEEAKRVKYGLHGAHTKNLFLRNKKGRMFLMVIEQDRRVDLKRLRQQLQLSGGQLAFASTERMGRFLGVVPGSVTPLAVFNDTDNQVQVYIERSLTDYEYIYLHPCRNTHTTRLLTQDLLRALHAWNHPPVLLEFEHDPES